MARTEKVIMTNMCMVFSENRILVQDKTDDDYSGITFPGGHVERGESFTDGTPDFNVGKRTGDRYYRRRTGQSVSNHDENQEESDTNTGWWRGGRICFGQF